MNSPAQISGSDFTGVWGLTVKQREWKYVSPVDFKYVSTLKFYHNHAMENCTPQRRNPNMFQLNNSDDERKLFRHLWLLQQSC